MKNCFFFLAILTISCVEPIEIEVPGESPNILVIEGGVTTAEGPHRIEISRTAKYGDIFQGFIERETEAQVSIRDNSGEVEFLTEVFDGVYQTDSSFKATVGNSYSLQILTSDGSEYISSPEKVVAVPEIDSISLNYEEKISNNPLQPTTGIQVYSNFKDNQNEDNYYFWRYQGIFQVNANPELNLDPETGALAPLDCCATCWATEFGTSPNIFSDRANNGDLITRPVAFIEDDGVRFGTKYLVVVSQMSITPKAHDFLQLVEQQLSIKGDIFDPPPATVRGNIIKLNDPNASVIGFFRASDIRIDSVFINRESYPQFKQTSVIRGDCRNYTPNATTSEPSFWF